ncbi:MAG TPA: hypothetical protein VG944_11075 [Fimbriimonas sp.]|nr:hypothetical protein [Fimbriimonas sp.]
MIASLLAAMALSSTQFRLGPGGEILAWLISGPFPNVGALQRKGTGFATDYLAGEAEAEPAEGQEIPMVPFERNTDPNLVVKRRPDWNLGLGNSKSGVDLGAFLNGSKPAVAYLYTTLVSPKERDAQILFGSDDGAKVYLNGDLLFQKQVARGIKRDEDRIPIHLKSGPNRLLFKIEQGDGGWGLLARLADLQGRGLEDVRESLSLDPSKKADQPGERWIRSFLGKPGAIDVVQAVRYDELSVRAGRWIGRFKADAVSPEVLPRTIAASLENLKNAADSDDLSRKLESSADQIEDEFIQARSKILRETQEARPLFRTEVQEEDYVKVMSGGRYFVHADGRPFIPIGYNHNPDWPKFEESNPEREVYEPQVTARYMAHLKESGVNVIRLMVETPPTGTLEDPIGAFSPEHVRWIDTIFAEARKNGIKLIVTPWDTFWMNVRFDTTPYNPALGGDLKERVDFITSPVLRKQEKKRIKFLIDHWGNTGTVFSWELLNEGDLWWGETPEQLRDWIEDMATYARDYEKKKWGRNHLLSVSISQAMPRGGLATDAFNLPGLDYATTHLYIGASKAPTEPVGPALAENEGVVYCLRHIEDRRPYIDTENGPIDKWIDSATLDNEVFRGMIWAHLASGAAGSGFRWPYRRPHHLTEGMLAALRAMSTFAEDVPWQSLAGDRVRLEASGQKGQATCGFGTGRCAIVWTGGSGDVTVRWPDGPATVRAKAFDCHTGMLIKNASVRRIEDHWVVSAGSSSCVAFLLTSG